MHWCKLFRAALAASASRRAGTYDTVRLGYALVTGPHEWRSRQSHIWFRGSYEGFGGGDYERLRNPHRWFLSQSGFGLVDPCLTCLGEVPALLIAYAMSGVDQASRLGLHDYIGEAVPLLSQGLRLMLCEGLSYEAVNDRKFLARSLFEWNHPNYSLIPFNLKGLEVRGRRVFLLRSLLTRFQGDPTFGRHLKWLVTDTSVEIEDQDWAVFRNGVCPREPVLSFDNPVLVRAKESDIVALVEWYPRNSQEDESDVAERWMALLGDPIVPFDLVERKKLFQPVRDSLKSHIDLWQAKITKHPAKSDDDSGDLDEAPDAEDVTGTC